MRTTVTCPACGGRLAVEMTQRPPLQAVGGEAKLRIVMTAGTCNDCGFNPEDDDEQANV